MRSTAKVLLGLGLGVAALLPVMLSADEHKGDHDKLPPGPIRERHELMESMGDSAEDINNAFSMGTEGFDIAVIQREAMEISENARKIPSLFPKGSTDPNSRALPAIWENWDKFEQDAKNLQQVAASLSNDARTTEDEELQSKSKKLFAACKTCHDQFRKPEEKSK
jgi:cytochrome c556